MCSLLTVFSEFVPGPPERGEHLRVLVGEGSRVTGVAHDVPVSYHRVSAIIDRYLRV